MDDLNPNTSLNQNYNTEVDSEPYDHENYVEDTSDAYTYAQRKTDYNANEINAYTSWQ